MASPSPRKAARAPTLEILDSSTPHHFVEPMKRIHEGHDVARFLISRAYRDIGAFILQLNHALCPRHQPGSPSPSLFPLTGTPSSTPSIQALQALLSSVDSFIGEVPPDPGPRRFGNVSFRKWHALLEERLAGLLRLGLLGETLQRGGGKASTEVASYLLGSFGSAQRLDYGTGHELSFVAFLGCLWKLGHFRDGIQGGSVEREIVLSVIEPYLRIVRKVVLTYTLEPAGSHGVWGLDDHSFIPYIFGSAQLTRPINDFDPMPTEGSVKGSPRPSDVVKAPVVEDQRQANMYFAAIGFINDVKKGPFWEHSPILFDISGIRDGWGKINKGMIKMFDAEVLSKFPVVQHFPFGSLFAWDEDSDAVTPARSVHIANLPNTGNGPALVTGTAAPWAHATRTNVPGSTEIPYSTAPAPILRPGPSTRGPPSDKLTGASTAAHGKEAT